MNKYITILIFTIFFIFFNIQLGHASTSDVSISEILFDPANIDTGLEYIIVKNFGNTDVNITGWNLYPDGIGYFTFPYFILKASTSVKIFLHKSGTNNQENLYHSLVSGNMGNSSGSVAIFSSTTHNKNTIVSFVRYQKIGSIEHKTWESTAVSAGIWTNGTFIDVSGAKEGQAILLKDFSQKINTQGWGLGLLEDIQKTPVKQSPSKETINYFSKKTQNTKQSEALPKNTSDLLLQKDLSASSVDAIAPKKFSSYLWLIIGIGGGMLAGLLFIFIKRLIT